MAMAAYVVAAILGGLLCTMLGASVWQWMPDHGLVMSAGLFAGSVAGIVVMFIFMTYERRVIKPLEAITKKLERQLDERNKVGKDG